METFVLSLHRKLLSIVNSNDEFVPDDIRAYIDEVNKENHMTYHYFAECKKELFISTMFLGNNENLSYDDFRKIGILRYYESETRRANSALRNLELEAELIKLEKNEYDKKEKERLASLVIPERISKLSNNRLLRLFRISRFSNDYQLIKAEMLNRGHIKRKTKTGDNVNHKTINRNG